MILIKPVNINEAYYFKTFTKSDLKYAINVNHTIDKCDEFVVCINNLNVSRNRIPD